MTIRLPEEVESSIREEVRIGHFASVDEALAEAWRQFRRRGRATAPDPAEIADPLLGSMGDHGELIDRIVADAMQHREQQPWRSPPGE